VKNSIEYKDVGFAYDGVGSMTLSGVNLEIKKGDMVAFVGSSGAGKTTIVNLLPRFYDASEGSILIDGVNIKDYKLASLRDNISLVTQDVMLFNDTAKYNIAYGTDGASDETLTNAAIAAYAHDFISKMPQGYMTKIGERGTKLSGGEKQRIAIARAILKDSPILILDEATSALDSESELIVKKALDNLMKGRTTLVIAHRLSTVRNADKIVVVEDGHITEMGTHFELLEKNGSYKRLHDMQFFVEEKDAAQESISANA
jgi:subfamily B ATP-binding cassette protein MsbA